MNAPCRRALASLTPAAVLLPLLLATPAQAKDLRGQLGVGFHHDFAASLTGLSVRVGLPAEKETVNVLVQVLAGFHLAAGSEERAFAGGRLLAPIVAEDNLNAYWGVGGGWIRFDLRDEQAQDDAFDTDQAFRGQAFLGAEFFLFGLERLGLCAELGINVDVGPGGSGVAAGVGTTAALGVHYYFGKK